jgi:hypothetical protein
MAILAFIAAFAMALGPIPWIVCSEVFPTKIRGRAMSVATFTIWVSCYVVAQTFPMLNDHPDPLVRPRRFLVYAAFSLAAGCLCTGCCRRPGCGHSRKSRRHGDAEAGRCGRGLVNAGNPGKVRATIMQMDTNACPESGSNPGRLMSLDALRGFTMFWIIGGDSIGFALAESGPSGWLGALCEQLEHVTWEGFRFYDLIFPMFIFIVGVSIVFSLTRVNAQGGRPAAVRRILRRTMLFICWAFFTTAGGPRAGTTCGCWGCCSGSRCVTGRRRCCFSTFGRADWPGGVAGCCWDTGR